MVSKLPYMVRFMVSKLPYMVRFMVSKFGQPGYATALYCLCFGTGMAFGQSLMGGIVRQNVGFNSSCLVQAAILLTSNAVSLFYLIRGRLLFE